MRADVLADSGGIIGAAKTTVTEVRYQLQPASLTGLQRAPPSILCDVRREGGQAPLGQHLHEHSQATHVP